jgi:mono/diheme cytochrome c family protein
MHSRYPRMERDAMRTAGWPDLTAAMRLLVLVIAGFAFILAAGPATAAGLFDKSSIELGNLNEGRTYHFPVELRNISGRTLSVERVIPSCGCTEVSYPKGTVSPGGVFKLEVTIDTTGKIGRVVKGLDIYTPGADEPFELVLTAKVSHPEGSPVDAGVIFRGTCAACHVGEGVEKKTGAELYNAVCYMCHKEADTFAPMDESLLLKRISQGKPGTSMPGFLRAHGGPLDARQVDSLAEYILKERSSSKPE